MFVFLQRKGGRDCDGPVWGGKGGEERGREGVGMFFGKKCLMTKGTLCNFLCWAGSLGEEVVMVCEKEKIV